MSKTMVVAETVTVPGIGAQARTFTLTSPNEVGSEPSVPAAKTGSLTVRTNTTDGTITLDAGHGLTTGTFDIFWSGGSRSQVTCTITVNACVITGGTGDDLPAAATAMTVSDLTSEAFVFTGDNAVGGLFYSNLGSGFNTTDLNGYIHFTLANDTVEVTYKLTALVPSNSWDGADVSTNPFAGLAIAKVKFSNGNTAARTMGAYVLIT